MSDLASMAMLSGDEREAMRVDASLRAIVMPGVRPESRDLLRRGDAADGREVGLSMLGLGGREVRVRSGTSDLKVLIETFEGMWHLPPAKLADDAVILDLGSNIGTTAADMGFRYPRARVWCVEMDGANAEMCRKNTAWMGDRCRVEHGAAWVESGAVKYGGKDFWSRRVRWIWDLANLLAEPEIGSVRAIGVRDLVERVMDEWRPKRGVIDYVKMDVEGSEAAIFEGDVDWLRHVSAIRVHVHQPVTIERIISRLTTGGMVVRRCWKHHRSVVATSRATAGVAQRWPVAEVRLQAPVAPI